ncbi:MAG TPA: Coagulation factor 5/8 type domain-containing protein [Solirubrobacteraceae bacterium]|jgi:hypothetical protein|nr:Coagulation factor 5/8 type domain-containing protein [Solirubrobacteraceae bacterium]
MPILILAAAVIVALASSEASTGAPRASTAQAQVTRYSLVNGCYTLHSSAGGNAIAPDEGPFRMQAAALGVYLLYGARGDYLTDSGTGTPQGVSAPSTAAEWRVEGGSSQGFSMTNLGTSTRLPVTFVPASGCAQYPEAQVDATGPAFTGASPEANVLGTVEGHAHVTAFEFFGGDWHCGGPWSPFGAPYALPADCSPDQQGTNGAFESVIDFGGPTRPSDMHGWPTFREWPSPTALAEEGDYYTGIERAWKAGLRLMVTNLVDNEALCSVMTKTHNPCNDMASVHIQSHDLYALQDYIDAQSGGPGQGWFRIVTDPFQARQVINEGKLAVIEGIEVSRIFGCGQQYDVPQCDRAQVDAGLKEIHDLGVRTFFPIHEFDNAFGGTKMIAGGQGAVVNAGNRKETGSFWTVEPCPAEQQDAPQLTSPASSALAPALNGVVATLAHGNPVPVYPPGPHCNVRGLTDLGAYVIKQMINQHFLIQLDHMSSKSATAAVSIAEGQHYSGLISAHCCSSAQLFTRIYASGGFISPPVSPAAAFAAQGKVDKSLMDPRYHFGFGWGSDENGLGDQPGPASATPISYPFKSFDGGVTFTREQWGQRTFDLNTDGLANYGMYADWLQELQQVGGRPLMTDMFQGAEAYLQTWERAVGVPAMSCRPVGERFTRTGLGNSIQLGQSTVDALYRAGQPLSRPGRSYRYCVTGPAGQGAAVIALFNGSGQLSMIASTAPGDLAGRIGPGSRARRLRRRARRVMPGVWVGRRTRAGTRYVYGVRRGRVRFVAVTTASTRRARARRSKAQLRSDLQAAGL